MATTTIRVSLETRDLLHQLARATGASTQQVLEAALREYRRRQFLESLNSAYALAAAGSADRVAEDAEQSAWDNTLLDGLPEKEAWHES